LNHMLALTSGFFTYEYPAHPVYGGLAAAWKPYEKLIHDQGGKISLQTRVKRIVIEGGKARGVIVTSPGKKDDELINGDHVVFAALPQHAFKQGLLKYDDFPSDYSKDLNEKFEQIKKASEPYDVSTVNVWVGLKKHMTDEDYLVILDNKGRSKAVMYMLSDLNPNTAPPGRQLLQFSSFDYKAPREYKLAQKHAAKVIKRMREVLPNFDREVDFVISSVSPNDFGELNNNMFGKPIYIKTKTPIDNFHFAGTQAGHVGMEGAMLTGAHVAEEIYGGKLIGV